MDVNILTGDWIMIKKFFILIAFFIFLANLAQAKSPPGGCGLVRGQTFEGEIDLGDAWIGIELEFDGGETDEILNCSGYVEADVWTYAWDDEKNDYGWDRKFIDFFWEAEQNYHYAVIYEIMPYGIDPKKWDGLEFFLALKNGTMKLVDPDVPILHVKE